MWLILFNLPYNRWVWNIICGLINFIFASFKISTSWFLTKLLFPYAMLGSFSRSAVNHESGAKTGLSGLVMGIIMGCALLFLTPVFEYIPQVKEFVWRCKVFTWLSVTRLLSTVTSLGAIFPVSWPLSWLQFVTYAMVTIMTREDNLLGFWVHMEQNGETTTIELLFFYFSLWSGWVRVESSMSRKKWDVIIFYLFIQFIF